MPEKVGETKKIYALLTQAQSNVPFCLNVRFKEQETEIYDCLAEMERMLMNWRRVAAIDNENGKVIPSYPKTIVSYLLV